MNGGGRGRVVEAGKAESSIRLGTTATVCVARVCPGGDVSFCWRLALQVSGRYSLWPLTNLKAATLSVV